MPVICGDHMQTGPTGLTASDKQKNPDIQNKRHLKIHHSTLHFKWMYRAHSHRESHDDIAQLNEKSALKKSPDMFLKELDML